MAFLSSLSLLLLFFLFFLRPQVPAQPPRVYQRRERKCKKGHAQNQSDRSASELGNRGAGFSQPTVDRLRSGQRLWLVGFGFAISSHVDRRHSTDEGILKTIDRNAQSHCCAAAFNRLPAIKGICKARARLNFSKKGESETTDRPTR